MPLKVDTSCRRRFFHFGCISRRPESPFLCFRLAAMAPSAAQSSEQQELALLNRQEFKIATIDSETKLSAHLQTFLAPILLKLASPHLSVRNKVISICQHLNIRVKPDAVRLPVVALLNQLKNHLDVPLIVHFDLVYALQGFKRLSAPDQASILPILVKDASRTLAAASERRTALFHLLLLALDRYRLPAKGSREDEELRPQLGMTKLDAETLSDAFGKLMLFAGVRLSTRTVIASPGLSSTDLDFLTMKGEVNTWDPASDIGLSLSAAKGKVLSFLSSGAFRDGERFLPALLASSDGNSSISEQGDQILKYSVSKASIDNAEIIDRLYSMYPQSKPSAQVKILSYLSKSILSTRYPQRFMDIMDSAMPTNLDSGSGSTQAGLEVSKLRSAIFGYANFFLRNADETILQDVAALFVRSLQGFIQDQGWPNAVQGQDRALRKSAYELLGLATKSAGQADMELLKWLFISLRDDLSDTEIGLSIADCMASVIDNFVGESIRRKDVQKELAELLLEFMQPDQIANSSANTNRSKRNTRYVAVRIANRCLPFSDPSARWINVLAVAGVPGDQREVREEGRKGLDPYWFRLLNSEHPELWRVDIPEPRTNGRLPNLEAAILFPGFERTVDYFFGANRGITDLAATSTSSFFGLPLPVLTIALQFSLAMFLQEGLEHSGTGISIDAEWARKLETALVENASSRRAIRDFVRGTYDVRPLSAAMSSPNAASEPISVGDCNGFHFLLGTTFRILSRDDLGEWPDDGLYEWRMTAPREMFTQLLPLVPDDRILIQCGIADQFCTLTPSLSSNQRATRSAVARAYGILFSILVDPAQDQKEDLEEKLRVVESWKSSVGASINRTHGYLEAVSNALSRVTLRDRKDRMREQTERVFAVAMSIVAHSSDSTLLDSALTAIAQFGMFTGLAKDLVLRNSAASAVFEQLLTAAKKPNEKAVYAFGRLSIQLSEEVADELKFLNLIDDALYALHEIREIEAQFTVGEALCCVACSWDCEPLQLEFDVNESPPATIGRKQTLLRILDRTIVDCRASKPSLRKASVIWLLCFVQFCGRRVEVLERLAQCQAAFMNCLSDRNDLVQEAASRGLGLVYERGGQKVRDDLVRQLVSSFTGDRSGIVGQVSEDTELFDVGALPTGDGSISTYRDILSLAAEVGDPSLVYRFMSLAANNAIWTSRAAFGRFGLSNIFEASSVDGYLSENPKIYPKLYRYRFDPNPNVRRAMEIIWSSVVKDTNRILDQRFDAIIEDLLKTILSREWRVREASCAAIVDLIQGRRFEQYEAYYSDIWEKCFKVMDDIKQTVQMAAAKLAEVLTNILVRNLESGDSSPKASTAMLKNVLPFLLSTSGVESGAKLVQAFSLKAVTDIVKKAGPTVLRPFIPELVERFIGLSTDLEGGAANYVRQRSAEYDVTEQDVDDIRMHVIRMGPLTEAIERCLDLLDDETTSILLPALERAMRSAIDLPSKVTCSRIIVSMSTRRRALFQPYADRVLALLERYILDRNDTVASAYATAAGYLARLASDRQILHIVAFAREIYSTSDQDRERVASGVLVEAIARNAKDRFASLTSDILPFVYIAKHDRTSAIKELYENVWQDNTGGSRAVQLYLKEIIALAVSLMDSPRWNLKHTAALAVADATNALADSMDGISAANGEALWPALEKALGGKTWDGKGTVASAFDKFVKRGQRYWGGQPQIQDDFLKVSAS